MTNDFRNIRHIIFDLGGVLLNIDYSLTEQAFQALGIENFGALYGQLKQTTLFDDLETGRISGQEFIRAIQQQAGDEKLTDEAVTTAWNAMLLDFPMRRLQLLEQLRRHYDLFLLSNTNEIHELAFNAILAKAHSIPSIASFFDKVYYSHRIGLRKPDEAAFRHILDDQELKPEQTLFIDDSPQHVEAAKALGIQPIFLATGATIEDTVFRKKQSD